jgi:hydrogenase maturation protease
MNTSASRVLVAGIGNIFLGDDAFGVEVIRRLSAQPQSQEVTIRDFGIRGFDLAYALNEAWETVILVDALSRGERAGTIFVLEPSLGELEKGLDQDIQPHGMDPLQAIRMAKSLGDLPPRLLVVGCEPADLGGDDGAMGLSAEVHAALDPAIKIIERLVSEALASKPSQRSTHEVSAKL